MCEVKGISVIIPLYNSSNTIIKTLESIVNQTRVDLIKEIIIVNDGSTDNSKELVEEFIAKTSTNIILINKKNGGVSSARNVGIYAAEQEWIAFCDADDIWIPDKIDKQFQFIQSTDVDLVGGNHTSEPTRVLFKKITTIHKANVKELCIKMFPQTSTIVMKRNVALSIGGFDEEQSYAEDGNFFIRVAARFNYYYMPDQMVIYDCGRRGFGVAGLSANLKMMQKGNLKNLRDFRKDGIISIRFYLVMYIFYYVKYIRRLVITNQKKEK